MHTNFHLSKQLLLIQVNVYSIMSFICGLHTTLTLNISEIGHVAINPFLWSLSTIEDIVSLKTIGRCHHVKVSIE